MPAPFSQPRARPSPVHRPPGFDPQYRQDISERLGITVEHITTPSQARRVAKHLCAGGEGWYITHYEMLSRLGVKNERLPVQTVPVHQAGEKVLVGSDLIETGRWLCDRLLEKGVRAGHIVEERDGKAATVNPCKRAVVMRDFRHGSLQVLLCGIPAISGTTSTPRRSSSSTDWSSVTRCSTSSSLAPTG